jgi:hypothetical protein
MMSQELGSGVVEQKSAVQSDPRSHDSDHLANDDHANPQRGATDSAWKASPGQGQRDRQGDGRDNEQDRQGSPGQTHI